MPNERSTIPCGALAAIEQALEEVTNMNVTLRELCAVNLNASSPLSIESMSYAVEACLRRQEDAVMAAIACMKGVPHD